MIDLNKLKERIKRSGLKKSFIAHQLSLSHNGFTLKLKGVYDFRIKEVQILSDLLCLTPEDREDIFFD